MKLLIALLILTSSTFAAAKSQAVASFLSLTPYGMGDYAGGNAQSKPCSFHIIPRLHDEPGVAIHIFSNIFDKVTYILTDDEAVFVFNHKDKFFKKSSHFISEETHFIESTIQAQGLDYGALEVTITNKIIEDGRIKKDTTIECTVI